MGEKKFSETKVITFLYLLCRDHLVSGKIEEILESVEAISVMPKFSNANLLNYVTEIAEKLKDEEGSEPEEDKE